jgi:anaphase-promoting complex subunit 4
VNHGLSFVGRLLAIASSDRLVRLIGSDNSKTVHQLEPLSNTGNPDYVGWGIVRTSVASSARKLHYSVEVAEITLDDETLSPHLWTEPDLPLELAMLEVESSLPKLAVLPPESKEFVLKTYTLLLLTIFSDDVFSSRASVDSIFHSASMVKVKTTDVLLIGNDDGTFTIQCVILSSLLMSAAHVFSIYDCFEIGAFDLKRFSEFKEGCKVGLWTMEP